MTQPVTITIPSLFDPDQFDQSLPPLIQCIEKRALNDEILIVDDTGEALLEPWLKSHFPSVSVIAREANGGFAQALHDGIKHAHHELVFCMNPDVYVRPGFLEPLIACLQDPAVHSVVPRILLGGDEDRIESVTEITFRGGLSEMKQAGLEEATSGFSSGVRPVPYGVGGAFLLRRDEFLEAGGFDPIFEPFYWEDVDLGTLAWRRGLRVLYQPASVVEHHHRGTIKTRVREDLLRAVIEKNRLLYQWKHLDDPKEIREHLMALHRLAIDAWLQDERRELVWLAMALEQAEELLESREHLSESTLSFAEFRAASAPGSASRSDASDAP